MYQPTIKVQPNNTKVCPKCKGTGFYCMGYVNNQPYSQTGFVCFACNGVGYIEIKKRLTRQERQQQLCDAANTVQLKGTREVVDAIVESGKYKGKILKIVYID